MGERDIAAKAILLICFVLFSAVVTAAEAALGGLNENSIRRRSEEGDRKSAKLLKFLEHESSFLHTAAVIVTGLNLCIGFTYAISLYQRIMEKQRQAEFADFKMHIISVLVFLLLIYIVALFGSILPKKLAVKYGEGIAYSTVSILTCLVFILRPVIFLMEGSTNLILRFLRINPGELEENVTQEEIISMVQEGHEQGVLEENEMTMISNIISFDEKEVKDIMTHRKKVVALNTDFTVEQALQFMLDNNFSRYPLYEENIDDIVGVLHLKDVIRCYLMESARNRPVKQIARNPHFIPDTQSIDVLFHNMQLKKIHMVVAIDEYGQTAGIVAMEDILEEIVGNILDEYDEDEKDIIAQGEGKFLMKGLTDLEEVEEALNIEIDQKDFDTLNGLLIFLLDRIPSEDENTILSYMGYSFQIVDVKNKIIRYVRVTKEKIETTDS